MGGQAIPSVIEVDMHSGFDDLLASTARHFFWTQIAPIQWWHKKQPTYGSNSEHPKSIT